MTSSKTTNWLDRLRSSRGFLPDSPNLDLDHFLSRNPNPNPKINKPQHDVSRHHHLPVNLISDALSDIFVMGTPTKPLPNPKSSRKQPKPRNLVASADASSENAPAKLKPKNEKKKKKKKKRESCGQKDLDVVGFSRIEVTVIDTSSPGWKSARVAFRKGTVWKSGEPKVRSFGKKKKKKKFGLVGKMGREKEKSPIAAAAEEVASKGVDLSDTDNQVHRPRRKLSSKSLNVLVTKQSSCSSLEDSVASKDRLSEPGML